MKYITTIFKNIFDNDASNSIEFKNWESFERFLYDLSNRSAFKPKRGERIPWGKKSALLLSPANYNETNLRRNVNVLDWTWCALDVDDHDFDPELDLKDQLVERIGDYYFIISSTASSKREHVKFRLIFPFKTKLPADNIPDFWFAINRQVGNVGDAQTKDMSRMFYTPGRYENAFHFFIVNEGQFMDPFALISKHPNLKKKPKNFMESLPKAARDLMIDFKRKQSKAVLSYTWNSYKNCPFVNKSVIKNFTTVATIDNSGRYFKLYKIMVSIAANAIHKKYPITPGQIVDLINQIDIDNGARYQGWRDMQKEAEHAITYAYEKT